MLARPVTLSRLVNKVSSTQVLKLVDYFTQTADAAVVCTSNDARRRICQMSALDRLLTNRSLAFGGCRKVDLRRS